MQHKLVFIETQDVVETTLALDNYRRACDCGRGAVFFSVARYLAPQRTRSLKLTLLLEKYWTTYSLFVWRYLKASSVMC